MIGSRIGSKGTLYSSKVGSSADDEGGFSSQIPGVSRDSGSGIYLPANATEWTAMMSFAGLATGNPSVLYNCQDASTSLADSISGISLVGSGTGLAYQQGVAGWARAAVTTTDNGSGAWLSSSAAFPDGLTASQLTLCVLKVTAASGRALFGQHTGATRAFFNTGAVAVPAALFGATTTNGATSIIQASAVVGVIKHDRTHGVQTLYTNLEKVTTVFDTTVSGQRLVVGSSGPNSGTVAYLYCVSFFNAAAELSDAQVKTLLTALGWTIPWS